MSTRRHNLLLLVALAALSAFPASASAADELAGLKPGVDYVPGELLVHVAGKPTQLVKLPSAVDLGQAAGALEGNPRVDYAVPNYIATAATFPPGPPNDPGKGAGWQAIQWNFLGQPSSPGTPPSSPGGVDALGGWNHLIAVGRPGASGVKIAVLDSGIAYRKQGKRFRASPDFIRSQFAKGRDFVDKDNVPLDLFGHGTHIAGTIGEQVNNGIAVTGLAYGAKMIPVRVLDRNGKGSSAKIANGIRFAAKRGARVINLSFDFAPKLGRKQLPDVYKALKFATKRKALVVASASNRAGQMIPYPAAGPNVIAVGATTSSGCLAGYSNRGPGIDIVAPGGGADDATCPPNPANEPIFQLTFSSSNFRHFGLSGNYIGTSQAAAHVSAIAAMVIARGIIGGRPSAAQMVNRLQSTGTPVTGAFNYLRLVNAGGATAP
jgi:serine protease